MSTPTVASTRSSLFESSRFGRRKSAVASEDGAAAPPKQGQKSSTSGDASLTLRERLKLSRFLRGEKPAEGPVTLTHRRIFIVPNRPGIGLGVLLVIQWLAAINYNNNLGFILTFLLASLALIGMLHCFRNLSGLQVSAGRGEPVFAGETALVQVNIRNPTPLPRGRVDVHLKGNTRVCIDVPADASATADLPMATTQRGWLKVGTVTVSTVFPMGIFYAWSPLNFPPSVLVYPAPAPDPLPFPAAEEQGRASRHQTSAEDFQGFQSYQRGDPIRHLHWKGIAKGQAPQLKRYAGEEAENLHLDWLQTPGGNMEARLSRLCRWILDAERQGLHYSLNLPGRRIALGSGTVHCRNCLEALALFEL